MDPVFKLPPELTAEIFSYLDPQTLLTATLASRSWRARILDSRLWRELYFREGWGLDINEVRRFEKERTEAAQSQARKSKIRQADTDVRQPKLKKRVPSSWFGSRNTLLSRDNNVNNVNSSYPPWKEQHGSVEADDSNMPGKIRADAEGDHEMHDATYDDQSTKDAASLKPFSPSSDQTLPRQASSLTNNTSVAQINSLAPVTSLQPPLKPSVLAQNFGGSASVNWPFLYKQRRRLEENWTKGCFTNFQLPHPSYPAEAHRECVYAIQFTGKWLVSGSRDKTVRVWDLETKRLRGLPLVGHTKSVLCLQFDPSEKEDLIVSGSSDKNVILWRFSTGEKIQEINDAHKDSVLNLRFDERFLVTCSKDKMIKVWNRHELSPKDKNYPKMFQGQGVKYPSYIVDVKNIPSAVMEAEIGIRQIKTLAPYSLLMTLDGHGAAVNAIQIGENEIVSASGDRSIKIWDIHSGACQKTLIGHQKGIACVQLDSRRIVSGSNDDTVRIYDHISGAEVACLQGHLNLVRTVQAGFGDLPGADEALRLEAMAVDSDYWDARRSGVIPDNVPNHRRSKEPRRPRNAGSKNPEDIMALGAKIPPGGGGSKWGRIVSGSYDESIIIWRKDRDGRWVIGQRLRQEDGARAASLSAQNNRQVHPENPYTAAQRQPSQPASSPHPSSSNSQGPQPASQTQSASQAPNQNTANHRPQLPGHPSGQGQANNVQQPQLPNWSAVASSNLQPPSQPQQTSTQAENPSHTFPGTSSSTQAPSAPPQQPNQHVTVAPNSVNRPAPNPVLQPTSRVFKLQFDDRKIVCASQDTKIVGWDFANGDREIEEACRFFTGL